MPEDPSFEILLERLRKKEQEAATDLFQRFAQRLIALARTRLKRLPRQKEDPEDVVQSVFRSFFQRHSEGQLDLRSWDGLWALLTLITLRKCGHRIEYFLAERRNVRREVDSPSSRDSWTSWQGIARDPTPSEAIVLAETIERLLEGLDDRDRQIIEYRLQGYEVPE
jgi:RNA polymerase sigma-70 factor (ECF subfamily)